MDLVIVESPTKAKTLSKFLGKGYEVTASMGHILDLPKSKLGVDTEHNFEPEYVPSLRSKPVIKTLKSKASKASAVWLSTDPDREGEAIAWHIMQVLESKKLSANHFKRAVFHEITKEAVDEAFKSPRNLDINLVNSQQARRVLDRLVGYKLSPLLWKKVRYGLSAGRVQSVAVRLIVERERERLNFKSTEYWSVEAEFSTEKNETFNAELSEINGKKIALRSKGEVDAILEKIKESAYKVTSVETSEKRKNPYAPFTTSSLQQAAGNRYGFTASRVMKAAQVLYENGLITYMRTDSTNLAVLALTQIRQFIDKEYGSAYLPEGPRIYKTKSKMAQEAHEAIRPTKIELRTANLELSGDEAKIYELIWLRTVACQMREALFEQTSVTIEGGDSVNHQFKFKSVGSLLKFDGWLKLLGSSEESGPERRLPSLLVDESLRMMNLIPLQHFTEAPARFTEATLIKTLEELGIGRPSTYAPTINTIIARGYVGREGRALYPYEVGMVVNDLLVKHFPTIVDFGFTAEMEDSLDEIAEGKKEWVPVIRTFYTPFEKQLEIKEKEIKKEDVTTLGETGEKCPECGKSLVIKLGKFGKFLSCTGFPKCKFAAPMADATSDSSTPRVEEARLPAFGKAEVVDQTQLGKCPEDQGGLMIKQGRFGQFIACKNYPKCKFTKPYLVKIGMKCPECGNGEVIVKRSGRGKVFFGCSRYPECKYASWKKPSDPSA